MTQIADEVGLPFTIRKEFRIYFNHGQHLGFDRDRNYPLPNLFVSVLHRLGIEEDKFSTATGTMRGLELRS